MEKIYVSADEFLRDTWRLAKAVLDSGWRPDVLLALWRGGAFPGAAVHEFLKTHGVAVRHAPLKCASYTGIGQSEDTVRFEYAAPVFDSLRPGTKTLVVDDVFDSGRTAAAVHGELERRGVEMKMAAVYWKPLKNVTPYKPDFFTKIVEDWIVFPHEIEGLSPEELAEKDPVLASLF